MTPRLTVRLDLAPGVRFGPGKALLLERIAELGSIAAAGRSMGMSYRRAWELAEAINRSFAEPAVARQAGGKAGGGATLTEFGRQLLARYRAIEAAAQIAGADDLANLAAATRPDGPVRC